MELKQLFKSTTIYAFSSSINMAVPLMLLPVLTRYMKPEDYGMVTMFGVLVSFISPFVGLSIHGSIARKYFESEKIDLPKYIANCLIILLGSTIVVSIIFYFIAGFIGRISSIPMQWLGLVIIVTFCQSIIQIVLTLWQVKKQSVSYGFFQTYQTLMNMGLTLLLVVGLGLVWKGRLGAQVITYVIFGIVSLGILYNRGWLNFSFEKSYIYNALSFGIPLIPHVIGGTIITMTDRVFINNMVSLEQTGIYSVGCQIGMIVGLLTESFNRAYMPWLFEKLKENHEEEKIKVVKFTYLYFAIIIFLTICLSIIFPLIMNFLIGRDFIDAKKIVFWIALAYSFDGMYKMVANYIFFKEKTYLLAWVTFSCACINIVLNYFLIKTNGAVGAAQATSIVFFMGFILTWKLSSMVYKMPWNLNQVEGDRRKAL